MVETSKQRGAVDYSEFLRMASENIRAPEAVGWLGGHCIRIEEAEKLGLGYVDPDGNPDIMAVLSGIYETKGEKLGRLDSPFIVIPYEGGDYWAGVYTKPKGLAKFLWARVGVSGIWGRSSLWAFDGEPVIIAADILDALALRALDTPAIVIDRHAKELLASTVKARAPTGPLVWLPSSKDAVEDTKQEAKLLGELGATALCYDLPGRDGFSGVMELMTSEEGGPGKVRELLADIEAWVLEDRAGEASRYLSATTGARIGAFKDLIGSRTGKEAVPTGFPLLDKILDGGLYGPGLYILGAISSLGKTTFALQIADNIAASKRDVLFFSLEQSADELIAKSLARITDTVVVANRLPGMNTLADSHPLTSRQILYRMKDWMGKPEEDAFEVAIHQYSELVGPRMFVIENDISPMLRKGEDGELTEVLDADGKPVMSYDRIGLDTIAEAIREHVRLMGRPPVVFIDYLQILRPRDASGRRSDKQNMDETVSELRRISKTYGVPIFAISSLNRSSYTQEVGMEAFKESGAIEYSSDVLIGLDPERPPKPKGKEVQTSRATYEAMASDRIRRLDVVVLKNRMGALGKVRILLDAPYGLYTENVIQDDDPPESRMSAEDEDEPEGGRRFRFG